MGVLDARWIPESLNDSLRPADCPYLQINWRTPQMYCHWHWPGMPHFLFDSYVLRPTGGLRSQRFAASACATCAATYNYELCCLTGTYYPTRYCNALSHSVQFVAHTQQMLLAGGNVRQDVVNGQSISPGSRTAAKSFNPNASPWPICNPEPQDRRQRLQTPEGTMDSPRHPAVIA